MSRDGKAQWGFTKVAPGNERILNDWGVFLESVLQNTGIGREAGLTRLTILGDLGLDGDVLEEVIYDMCNEFCVDPEPILARSFQTLGELFSELTSIRAVRLPAQDFAVPDRP